MGTDGHEQARTAAENLSIEQARPTPMNGLNIKRKTQNAKRKTRVTSWVIRFTFYGLHIALPTPTPKDDAQQERDYNPRKPRALLKHIVYNATHNRFRLELFMIWD